MSHSGIPGGFADMMDFGLVEALLGRRSLMYLQAQHLDVEFYDRFYQPGAYLRTHASHMARWHGEGTPVPCRPYGSIR